MGEGGERQGVKLGELRNQGLIRQRTWVGTRLGERAASVSQTQETLAAERGWNGDVVKKEDDDKQVVEGQASGYAWLKLERTSKA